MQRGHHARRRFRRARDLTFEDLEPLFCVSQQEAAERLGISATTLKKASRRLGLRRWPFRSFRAIRVAEAEIMGQFQFDASWIRPVQGQETEGRESRESQGQENSWIDRVARAVEEADAMRVASQHAAALDLAIYIAV